MRRTPKMKTATKAGTKRMSGGFGNAMPTKVGRSRTKARGTISRVANSRRPKGMAGGRGY